MQDTMRHRVLTSWSVMINDPFPTDAPERWLNVCDAGRHGLSESAVIDYAAKKR